MIKIGDKVRKKIYFGSQRGATGGMEDDAKATGTVVYIHPRWRFYVVRFSTPDGCFCESYSEFEWPQENVFNSTR